MVRFETSTYYKEGNNIVGAEVIVSAETGEEIGRIQVVSQTDFDNLIARIDALGNEYVEIGDNPAFANRTIENILQNLNENVVINATKLGGLQSDAFAKASHKHTVRDISNLYNFEVSLSKYKANLYENIKVKIKVTNQMGAVVPNFLINCKKNSAETKTGTTGSNGECEIQYQVTDVGLTLFTVNHMYNVQCLVEEDTGWMTPSSLSNNFENYSWNHKLEYRVKNRVVHIRGAVKPKSDINSNWNWIASIDRQYAPTAEEIAVVQGGLLQHSMSYAIHEDGNIYLLNDSNTEDLNIIKGTWLPLHATWFLD